MKHWVRPVLRWLLWPVIIFLNWVIAQGNFLRHQKLRKQLDAVDPDTVALFGDIRICYPERCRVGRGVAIHDAVWDAKGGIVIGDHVHFGAHVTILTHNHNYEGECIPYDETDILKPVVIEDNVWIGRDVVIAPGSHIEEGCVIAMGTVVSGRIPKGSIVGAAKWRVLKMRDLEKYERLKSAGRFT